MSKEDLIRKMDLFLFGICTPTERKQIYQDLHISEDDKQLHEQNFKKEKTPNSYFFPKLIQN